MHINVKSYNSSELFVERDISSGKYPFIPSLRTSLMFCFGLIAFVLWVTLGTSLASDPYVMKIYPDGTKVVLKWSEVGKTFDNGSTHGGPPKIVAYDPAKDGVVPIGQPSSPAPQSTSKDSTPSPLMATKQEPAITDAKSMNDADNYGPAEGFGFRTDVGVAFQQSLSGRDSGHYFTSTFQPGIRFDLEPFFNVTDWFSVGVETAFIHNTVHSISDNGDTVYRGNPDFGNGDLYQVPILANTRFQFPTEGPIKGFFGAGVGGNWQFANVATTHSDGTPYSATSYQWNYVFELSTGICYTISPGLDLNASFKTLCTPNPLGEGQNGQQKASYNYAAEVGVAWRF